MDELVREHIHGRELVRKLVEAKDLYVNGYAEALPHIARELKELVDFYPRHIEKEDKRFFFPCLDYFTQAEQDRMLAGVPGLRPEHDPREVSHGRGDFPGEESDADRPRRAERYPWSDFLRLPTEAR